MTMSCVLGRSMTGPVHCEAVWCFGMRFASTLLVLSNLMALFESRAAAASAARSVTPDDEVPPGYEQPHFRQSHANGWAADQATAPPAGEAPAAAAGRSGGGGWWESGPAAEPEQPIARGRGRGSKLFQPSTSIYAQSARSNSLSAVHGALQNGAWPNGAYLVSSSRCSTA